MSSKTSRRTPWSWRWGRSLTCPCCGQCPTCVSTDGNVAVDRDLMTDHPGVFAGGDMVAGARTLTDAIGHGKKAARAIDAWLLAATMAHRPPRASPARSSSSTPGTTPTRRTSVRPHLDAARRTSTFDEVVGGLDESTAVFEARRCMSCGNCFQCDNCFGVCPDNAVMKVDEGHGYRFDYDFCKGCGLCVQECPCGAIDMVPERSETRAIEADETEDRRLDPGAELSLFDAVRPSVTPSRAMHPGACTFDDVVTGASATSPGLSRGS